MPITVGSVGDIIALIQLAASVKKCLGASRGSSADFQGVVELMDSLQETLHATQKLLGSINEFSGASGSFDILEQRRLILAQIHRFKTCISDYMKQIQKYGKSLNKGGSKNALSDILRKLQWGTNEKSTMERFRQDVHLRLGMINLQSANLSRILERHRHFTMQKCCQEAMDQRLLIASTTESHLTVIEKRLDCIVPAWRDHSGFEDRVSSPLFANNTDLLALPMDRFWNCRIVIVRDPMGRQWPFPMGLVPSWGALEHAFKTFFENTDTKHEWLQSREYRLRNVRLGQNINRYQDFDSCSQSGELFDLTIIVVATLSILMCKSIGSLRRLQQQPLLQSLKDKPPPPIGLPRVLKASKTVRAFLIERRSLGPAILWLYPRFHPDLPHSCIEYRSTGSIDKSTLFSLLDSGRPPRYPDMELQHDAQKLISLSPVRGCKMTLGSEFSSLRRPFITPCWRPRQVML